MDQKDFLQAIQEVKKNSPKRNFIQSVDIIFNFKGYDPKKNPIDTYVTLPYPSKQLKICAFIDKTLETQAKQTFDKIVMRDDFDRIKNDKKEVKKLCNEYDLFVSQAEIMPQVASAFGKVLGPRGKMPNPKVGAVIPGKILSLDSINEKLKRTAQLSTKNNPTLKCSLGKESLEDQKLADNAYTLYQGVLPFLPQEKQNLKNILIKLTMGPTFIVGHDNKK